MGRGPGYLRAAILSGVRSQPDGKISAALETLSVADHDAIHSARQNGDDATPTAKLIERLPLVEAMGFW
ncbi:unnamed protein product [Pieris macdunnoughi]|uniref:Uncharacterized protein n=1 Tax=Pieris macdunnoughi TaxID=345717 RepID=A0A821SQ11_9NEOP|nr:unnamed protein product [Pieris macdunnoughi]